MSPATHTRAGSPGVARCIAQALYEVTSPEGSLPVFIGGDPDVRFESSSAPIVRSGTCVDVAVVVNGERFLIRVIPA